MERMEQSGIILFPVYFSVAILSGSLPVRSVDFFFCKGTSERVELTHFYENPRVLQRVL